MSMLRKGSKAYSIFHFKCPKCHEGDLFETPAFSFKKSFYMPEKCPVCQQAYFLEPGFYYGAMFISYIITGWFSLFFVGALIIFADWSVEASFLLLVAVMTLLFVWFFRIARSIWINLNVKYSPQKES